MIKIVNKALIILLLFSVGNFAGAVTFGYNSSSASYSSPLRVNSFSYGNTYGRVPGSSSYINTNNIHKNSISQKAHYMPSAGGIRQEVYRTEVVRTFPDGTRTVTQYYQPYSSSFYPYNYYAPTNNYYRTEIIRPITTHTYTTQYNSGGGTVTHTFTEEYSPYGRTIRY